MEKPIVEFPEYFASRSGEIISYKNKKRHVLKGGFCSGGYRGVLLRKDGKTIRRNVHRLVAATFLDNPNAFPVVNHIDGNKQNNNADNLEWCTFSANMKHAVLLGLHSVSQTHLKNIQISAGKSKSLFTEIDAQNIRAIYQHMEKPSCRKLAKSYHCSKSIIQRIVNGVQTVFKG